MIRGVRGAITIRDNNEAEIVSATEKLLKQIILENEIVPERVASVFISVTDEITSVFPARALRLLDGWTFVPVMCMKEIPVPGSLKNCIRVMMHVNTDVDQADIAHIYLDGAEGLRPDLPK